MLIVTFKSLMKLKTKPLKDIRCRPCWVLLVADVDRSTSGEINRAGRPATLAVLLRRGNLHRDNIYVVVLMVLH